MNQGIYGLGRLTAASGPYGPNGAAVPLNVQVLLVGGGGPGGPSGIRPAGGGGGGGVCEETLGITLGRSYTVAVGAAGSFSRFGSITAQRGGSGVDGQSVINTGAQATGGGSVNGSNRFVSQCSIQGFNGGLGATNTLSGGGGGAGAAGEDKTTGTTSGAGGAGRVSTIPTAATTYGGGGGGGGRAAATTIVPGAGGSGGGGAGSTGTSAAVDGAPNLGGGGGGGSTEAAGTRGQGGSGVVVLRFSSLLAYSIGKGLTYTVETTGSDTVLTFTAGTDTVSWS